MSIKKMIIKRIVKKKISNVMRKVERLAVDVEKGVRRLEKRVPIKIGMR